MSMTPKINKANEDFNAFVIEISGDNAGQYTFKIGYDLNAFARANSLPADSDKTADVFKVVRSECFNAHAAHCGKSKALVSVRLGCKLNRRTKTLVETTSLRYEGGTPTKEVALLARNKTRAQQETTLAAWDAAISRLSA